MLTWPVITLHGGEGEVSDWAKRASDAPVSEQPPSDNHSNLPKIGGTFGGFIALVVCLAVIVIFSCIAIFILLHKFKPDPYERHYRQTMFGKRESSIYEAPLGPQGMRAKFKNLIGRGKKSEGWVRAGNGSQEWDASDTNILPGQARGPLQTDAPPGDSSFSPPRPHSSVRRSSTSESIELSVPTVPYALSGATSGSTPTYSDPFASPTLPDAVASTQPQPHLREDDHFSVQSGDNGTLRSMRKFESGTKFKEAIDFQ